jgi:hypothetical protein
VAATIGAGQFGLLLVGVRAGTPAGLTSLVLRTQALYVAFVSTLGGLIIPDVSYAGTRPRANERPQPPSPRQEALPLRD